MAMSHGMDVGEVRRLGGSLQTSAGSIDDLIKRIESAVSGSTWVGPDSMMFKTQWWPEHRAHLKAMSETLHGLGQSALNNAIEQEQASATVTGGAAAPLAESPAGGRAGSESRSSPSVSSGEPGATVGVLSPHREDAEVIAAYRREPPPGFEPVPGNGLAWQCTAWARYRWRELGFDGPMGGGNGWQVATSNGGSADTPPSLGAIASYGSGANGDFGHVMIVEQIGHTSDGLTRIRVSEMNAEGLGGAGGIEALPEEYHDENYYVQQANGSWTREGRSSVGEIRFATFPGASQ